MQQDNKRHVPDWLLERLALGELDAETAADVRRRLAAEGRTADEIAALVATSNREILEELFPGLTQDLVEQGEMPWRKSGDLSMKRATVVV